MSYSELKVYIESKPGPLTVVEYNLIRAFFIRQSSELLTAKLLTMPNKGLSKVERAERDICRVIINNRSE